jgi:hypothetical protein
MLSKYKTQMDRERNERENSKERKPLKEVAKTSRPQNPVAQWKKPQSKVFQVDLMELSLGSTTHTPFETVPNEPCNSSALLFEQAHHSEIHQEPSQVCDEPENRNLMSITKQMVDAYHNHEADIMSFYRTPTH